MKNVFFKQILMSFAFLFAGALFAEDYNWAVPDGIVPGYWLDITGQGNPKMAIKPDLVNKKPVNCTLDQPGKEELRAFHLRVWIKAPKDQWTTATFTFKVRSHRKGTLRFSMQAQGNGYGFKPGITPPEYMDLPHVGFMGIAQITSKQIKVPNGGFFTSANLKAWGEKEKPKVKQKQATLETDKDLTDVPSHKYVRTCQRLWFDFNASPEQEITMTVTVKPLEFYKALH